MAERRKKPPKPVRVVFLGGLGEIGRNCACIEVDGRIVVLDCGIMFPDPDMPGVDLVLPEFTYLHDRKDRVDGIVLTHGHEDHTGGLAYLLRELQAPIYGSELTVGLARHRVEEAGLADRTRFVVVDDGERVRIGACDVEFIPVTHSVPEAMAIAFHTPQGVILHSGDFKLDLQPVDGRRTDMSRMGELARTEGIRLLLSDSTNAEEPGFTESESSVGVTLRRVFAARAGQAPRRGLLRQPHAPGAADHRRRHGQRPQGGDARALHGQERRARAAPGHHQHPRRRAGRHRGRRHLPPGEMCVISTGSQGEPMSALSLMATGDNKWLRIGEDDVVVISAHPIPGNEWSVGRVIDDLHRRGAEVVHSGAEAVHVSGHARQGELRTLIAVTKPGVLRARCTASSATWSTTPAWPSRWASTRPRCCCARTATWSSSTPRASQRDGRVPAGYVYVDGTVGDIEHGVLRDRQKLAEEGVVMVVVTVDRQQGTLSCPPVIETRGWVLRPRGRGAARRGQRGGGGAR